MRAFYESALWITQSFFSRNPDFHHGLIDDDADFVSKEFGALVNGGMTPIDALRAATVNGAELLGRSDEIGTLEPGKFADIVAVQGDPLADITVMEKVVFVMKGGEVYKSAK